MADEADLLRMKQRLVTREIHYDVSTLLDLILIEKHLYCIVEGTIDGIGPLSEAHTGASFGLISGHDILVMYMQVLLASSLVFSSGAVLLYCAALSDTVTGIRVLRAAYVGVGTRNGENIHLQDIIGHHNMGTHSPSVNNFKSQFSIPDNVIFLSLLSVDRDIL